LSGPVVTFGRGGLEGVERGMREDGPLLKERAVLTSE